VGRLIESIEARSEAAPSFGEQIARGVELQRGGVLVAEHPAGGADQQPQPCDLVGRRELAPELKGLTERRQRLRGVSLRQRNGAPGLRRDRAQDIAPLTLRDLLKLAARGMRALELAGGEHDLDVCGKQRDALERVRCFSDRPADRGGGRTGVALVQPQQGQARLRLEATPTRLAIGVLGRFELPSQTMDLPLPIVGLAAGELVENPPGEPLGRSPRLLQGLLPRAPELHDLGTMDEAEAVVGDHLGLALAPPGEGLGPLPAWRSS
jgi:hypothetical protein